jgi:hypothetical protein
MPFSRQLYPPDWETIRARILDRAGYRCEVCGLKNYAVGVRQDDGSFLLSEEARCAKEARQIVRLLAETYGIRPVVIILAVAHMANKDPHACDEENLQALCQWHHHQADKLQHAQSRARTRREKKRRIIDVESLFF